MDVSTAQASFLAATGRRADGVIRAPGRVNLIGEHTDYNNGLVLPIAIERCTLAAFARRDDAAVTARSDAAEGVVAFRLDEPITPSPADADEPAWGNYLRGVAAGLEARGVKLAGADLALRSDVPVGGGLSSSASLEVAVALALLAVAGVSETVPPAELARLCQAAENNFAGAPCGIMDQSIVVMGRANCALLLDCRDGSTEQIPFDAAHLRLLVADTQVRHAIGAGEYGRRRGTCVAAAEAMGIESLRETDLAAIEAAAEAGRLDATQHARARHVVSEIERTLTAADAIRAGDYWRFGELMFASHASLADDFQVSCDELDAIVTAAAACDGVYGARMTGGGFGGCAICLVEADRADAVTEAIAADFAKRFSRRCPIFATRPAAGAERIA